jgi:hypothetical protein
VALRAEQLLAHLEYRGLHAPPDAAASAVAVINSGQYIALVTESRAPAVALAFGETLADYGASIGSCVGWLCLHGTAGALIRWADLVGDMFSSEVWLVLANPSPDAIARILQETRDLAQTPWRLIAVTKHSVLREARLSPAARRLLVPVAL